MRSCPCGWRSSCPRLGGHDAIHTRDMAHRSRSTDAEIAELADREDRVVVSKDHDFRDGHLLRMSPRRLLVVATGNCSNDVQCALFTRNLAAIAAAFDD